MLSNAGVDYTESSFALYFGTEAQGENNKRAPISYRRIISLDARKHREDQF